jgi:dipeptidyl aminopeptidase/acylaminoacyl peptidase
MLDVHSPQDSVHTWTDFLIHIATIVIGLLIAVTGSGVALATNDAAVEVASTNSAVPRLVHRFLEVVIAPNGNYVASVEGDSPPGGSPPDIRELVVRRVADGSEVRVALPCGRVPQCWPSAPAWSPDSGHLSFALRTPGTHSYAVYDVTTASAHLTHLLTFNGTITGLKYSGEGTLALLAVENARKEVGATEAGAAVAGDLDESPPEQRIATLIEGNLRWGSPQNLFVYQYDWRPDGAGFVGTAAPGDGDDNWWTAKLYAFGPDGEARVLYQPVDLRQQLADPTMSPDGKSVAFIAGIMSDFGATGGDVYSVDLESGAAINVTPSMRASGTSLAWSCQGKLRATLLTGDQQQIVELGNGRSPAAPRVLWTGSETLHGKHAGASWACPSETLATAYETYTQPPEIRVGSLGKWRDLTHVNAGMTAPFEARSIVWHNEGFEIQGWLLLPLHTTGKIPMVTVVHGGPAWASFPSFSGPSLRTALIQRGWAVFYPNPRGSFGQGERFTAANIRDFGYGDLRDDLTGIDAVEIAAPIDEGRLGLTGGSYGGYMTMWAVTQTNRFKAAVADAGISDMLSYYGENGIDAWMLPYFGASVYDDPTVYARSSPITYIKNVRTPTFAYVGERDIECPAPQTQEFWHALKTLAVPTGIMIYPNEGHWMRDPKNVEDALERSLAWFDKYLK